MFVTAVVDPTTEVATRSFGFSLYSISDSRTPLDIGNPAGFFVLSLLREPAAMEQFLQREGGWWNVLRKNRFVRPYFKLVNLSAEGVSVDTELASRF